MIIKRKDFRELICAITEAKTEWDAARALVDADLSFEHGWLTHVDHVLVYEVAERLGWKATYQGGFKE